MQQWLKVSLLLCAFGFFREMRPSEPFVTEYLTGDWFNITNEQLNKEIFPFGTYAVLAQLVVIFLITDILRYKPIILVSAIAGIVLFSFLLWAKTIVELQIGQVFYGTFMASEVAYYTYIYAKVERKRYNIVTGHTRAAILCGKFLGGLLAQVLISTDIMNYQGLHYISFGSQVVSLVIALTLPPVKRSLYFYREEQKNDISQNAAEYAPDANIQATDCEVESTPNTRFSWKNATRLLINHTVCAFTNPIVVEWSIWWALITCGQLQVISYVQFLWKEIGSDQVRFYNGGVEATVTLLGAAGAIMAGWMNSDRKKQWHTFILIICPLILGSLVITSALTSLIWVAYAVYILFGFLFFFIITTASSTLAEHLTDDSFGLIFGINTLIALTLQTTITLCVVTNTGFGLKPRYQYLVYGSYFIGLGVLFCVVVVIKKIFNNR